MNTTYKNKKRVHHYNYLLKAKNLYQLPMVGVSTTLILTLVIICFFAFFAIKPTLITITKLNKELKEKQEVNKILEKKINDLNKAQISYAQVIDYLILVGRALPEKADFNQVASQINFLAFSNNIVLLSASFGKFDLVTPPPQSKASTIDQSVPERNRPLDKKENKITEVSALDFKISLLGSYANIKNFLQELENIDRVVQINSVIFSSKIGKNQIELQSDLSGKIFWLENEKKKKL